MISTPSLTTLDRGSGGGAVRAVNRNGEGAWVSSQLLRHTTSERVSPTADQFRSLRLWVVGMSLTRRVDSWQIGGRQAVRYTSDCKG